MAIYEYGCDQCGNKLTINISIKKYNPKEKRYCSNCNEEVKRIISPVGISFGKGFFRDGYESAKNVKTPTDGE
jgi:putative FmdB family regulatory protein